MNVQIGKFMMELPEGHRLAEMYAQYPTYDFLPWKIIRAVLGSNGLTDSTLVDIGANIGDTAAHFRNFSGGKIICVEPEPKFFYVLTRNSVNFGNVELINKLVCPSDLVGKVAFSSGPQTGGTAVADNSTDVWAGE